MFPVLLDNIGFVVVSYVGGWGRESCVGSLSPGWNRRQSDVKKLGLRL